MKLFKRILDSLIFPSYCISCSQKRYEEDLLNLCGFCRTNLPLTNHFIIRDNLFEQRFWGRIPLHAGASLFFFQKDGFVQSLMYKVKYESALPLAIYLGSLLGKALKNSADFQSVDHLVPIPLHPRKRRKRGYNQSELLCEGITSVWKKPVFKGVKRTKNTRSQTQMGRLERLQNLSGAMEVEHVDLIEPHFLIIDDVMTTGTTIEICALALLEKYPKAKISAATLGFADLW